MPEGEEKRALIAKRDASFIKILGTEDAEKKVVIGMRVGKALREAYYGTKGLALQTGGGTLVCVWLWYVCVQSGDGAIFVVTT